MDALTLADLKLFIRLAALGRLSALARERVVPVSQISRALARIETQCGARLMHRSTHALTLTPEGERFLAHCLHLTQGVEDLEAEFSAGRSGPSGLVRVAASSVIARHLVVPSLPGLSAHYPGLRIDIQVSDQLVDLAREGIDIAIRTTRSPPGSSIARPIGQVGRGLYAAPAYAQAHGLPQHPDELAHHTLVTNSAATHLNAWPFVVDGQPLRRDVQGQWQTSETALLLDMVAQGLGIGRVMTLVAQPLLRAGRLLPVLPAYVDPQPLPLYAIVAGGRLRLPKLRACIDYWSANWAGEEGLTATSSRP
ncbi:MAG: LysR family transcriptional regulator [Proteobacteria bacterium]|nr:LysR family transcriptional regulator [Pseudomonadota bacterium]